MIDKYAHRLRNNPSYPIKALKQDIRNEHVVDVSRSMLYRVRKDAASEKMGNEKEQYILLWSYCVYIIMELLCRNAEG